MPPPALPPLVVGSVSAIRRALGPALLSWLGAEERAATARNGGWVVVVWCDAMRCGVVRAARPVSCALSGHQPSRRPTAILRCRRVEEKINIILDGGGTEDVVWSVLLKMILI